MQQCTVVSEGRLRRIVIGLILLIVGHALTQAQQNTERPDLPNPYRTIENVVALPDGRKMGSVNAVNVDANGNINVLKFVPTR